MFVNSRFGGFTHVLNLIFRLRCVVSGVEGGVVSGLSGLSGLTFPLEEGLKGMKKGLQLVLLYGLCNLHKY